MGRQEFSCSRVKRQLHSTVPGFLSLDSGFRELVGHPRIRHRMLSVIPITLLILYSINLTYLIVWVNKTVQRYSCCADADVPQRTPSPLGLSQLIFVATLLHFFALTFWWFTDDPYRGRGGPWLHPGDDLGLLVIGLIGFCLASIGYVLYQLGKVSGTLERRKMEIYMYERRKQQ